MSCADVCIGYTDWAYTEFCSSEEFKARHEYLCCECSGPIKKGEKYLRSVGKTEGEFWQVRTCLSCSSIREALCCDGWTFGELWSNIESDLFDGCWLEVGPIDTLAKLGEPKDRQRLMEHYDAWKKENSHESA